MLVANGWLGEGSTVMANAERVKDAAEATATAIGSVEGAMA
jgi:hypothetical protein